tara:strand:+ start:14524 stop:16119 length:1596 start_codon:yes stop_codon:yes gene_type:complete
MKLKILGLLIIFFVCGCGNNIPPVELSPETKILYLGNGTEPKDLDPHTVTGVPESKILMALIEGLVIRHPEGLEPLPGIAKNWLISQDGKEYTFNLREALWSNGDPVTAHDFVYAWNRMLLPSLGSQYPDMLYDVVNAEQFNKGEITDFNLVGVKALDAKTLKVNLKNPAPYFLELLAHYTTRPVHKPTIEKFGEIDTLGNQWTRPGNFIGNGPFTLEEWKLNQVIKVKKNPNYWDADRVQLNEIHFLPIDNVSREDFMFRAGQIHITSSIPTEKIEVYKEEYPNNISISPYYGTYYYRINLNKKPLDNKLVRKALSLSIDRELITKKVAKGGQIPAFSFTPPDPNGYFPPTKLEYNPSKAKELLKEAGYSKNDSLTFELLYNTSEGHQKIAEAMQQMWKETLGINIVLTNTDWKVYLSRENNGDFEISRAGWIGDYQDPKTFLDMMVSGRGNNKTGWSNKEYDNLLIKAAQSTSQDERYKYLYEAEKILIDELPIIPIYTYTRIYMKHETVKGWEPNLLDSHAYQYITIE